MDRREVLRLLIGSGAYSLAPGVLKGQQSSQQQPGDLPLIPELPLESLPLPEHNLPLFPLHYVKFDIERMAKTLMDGRHEGLTLTVYPDPGNGQPDWSAGDGLVLAPVPERLKDLPKPLSFEGREYKDYEPRDVWVNAKLPADVFDAGLGQFKDRMEKWHGEKMHPKAINAKFLRSIGNGTFKPDITQDMANTIAREEVKVAASNSPFFCPKVYRLMNESQQEAMAHLVYQWGARLMELDKFIHTINTPPDVSSAKELSPEFMEAVQKSLIHEPKFFHMYRARATAVIAMFDPNYDYENPKVAEDRVREMAHLPKSHSIRKRNAAAGESLEAKLEKPQTSHTENARRRPHHKTHHSVG